jgi:tetratricopeptide (TPR) repeat protein
MKIQHNHFRVNEVWIACRLRTLDTVAGEPVDLYILMDAASGYVFGHLLVIDEVPSTEDTQALFANAYTSKREWPLKLIVAKLDPALPVFQAQADAAGITLEVIPTTYLEDIIRPIQESYDGFMTNTAAVASRNSKEQQQARSMVPDSYDPCPCASDKKFKFCCKPVFGEIVEAMCAFEEGRQKEAIHWLDKARARVGETAELLCRYAIVYSRDSHAKFTEYIQRALAKNPKHPRAHYLIGLDHSEHERFEEAADAYERAIQGYPATDKFHLNETWNNLGNVYYRGNRVREAKGAWEKALTYAPHDELTRRNLQTFIYDNAVLPDELRKPSPFVARLLL